MPESERNVTNAKSQAARVKVFSLVKTKLVIFSTHWMSYNVTEGESNSIENGSKLSRISHFNILIVPSV